MHGAKNLACRADFFARVNGVSILLPVLNSLIWILFISVLDVLTLFRGIYYLNNFVFRSVQKSKVLPYLKYLLLRDNVLCLQDVSVK